MNVENKFMQRALELARLGEGQVNPNPLVGAVVVKDGKIIGEGYHQKFGGPHAEAFALEAAGKEAKGADLYVNLEPCVHYDKKTPPCVDKIINSDIKRVYVAMRDPNPKVSGKGIKKLKEAGIAVEEGILEERAKKLNEIYCKFITTGRPFVLLKMAMTADGKIASKTGDSKWISSEESRLMVHKLRNKYAAVLVGVNTVLKDDPQLTVREIEGRDPWRIVLDSQGRIPLRAKILQAKSEAKTIIATTAKMPRDVEAALKERGSKVEVWRLPAKDGKVDLVSLIEKLAALGIDSLLVEGGATVAASFLKENLVDKIMLFIAPKIIGGREALTPVEGEGLAKIEDAFSLKDVSVNMVDNDVVYEAYLE